MLLNDGEQKNCRLFFEPAVTYGSADCCEHIK